MATKTQVLAGREAVDAYRRDHADLERYAGGWYKGMSEDHTPLLQVLVSALEEQGFTSAKTNFEPKKTEVLAKFEVDSDLLNIRELGFVDMEDYLARATHAEKEARMGGWH